VLSRLETFANPYDAHRQITRRLGVKVEGEGGRCLLHVALFEGGRTARVTRDRAHAERSLALRAPAHARTNFPHTAGPVFVSGHIRLVSRLARRVAGAALFTYDVPHYQAQAAAAASENFDGALVRPPRREEPSPAPDRRTESSPCPLPGG
jgi:hypothetical protein